MTDNEIHKILHEQIVEAEARARAAMALGAATSESDEASPNLSLAREELLVSQKRLGDYLGYGIVPEDLKRSG